MSYCSLRHTYVTALRPGRNRPISALRPLTESEITQLNDAGKSEWRLALALYTGVRVSDIGKHSPEDRAKTEV
jgi:hypothetical protein